MEHMSGDGRRASRGREKAFFGYSESKARLLASPGDLQTNEKVGNEQGKQTIPLAQRCARYLQQNELSVRLLYLLFAGATTLCDEVPRWLSLNKRGGSSLGETLADRSREASVTPNTLELKRRRIVTAANKALVY